MQTVTLDFSKSSAALQSFSHGTNDAQKSMGIITLALIVANLQNGASVEPQLWVKLLVPLQWVLVQQ